MLEFSVHEVSVFSENERERMIIWVVWCAVAGFVRGKSPLTFLFAYFCLGHTGGGAKFLSSKGWDNKIAHNRG